MDAPPPTPYTTSPIFITRDPHLARGSGNRFSGVSGTAGRSCGDHGAPFASTQLLGGATPSFHRTVPEAFSRTSSLTCTIRPVRTHFTRASTSPDQWAILGFGL